MKRKISLLLLAFVFLFSQVITGTKAKAEQSQFSVQVIVNGFDKVITTGVSTKENALQAADEVLNKNKINYEVSSSSWGGKYISSIDGIKEKHYGGWDGWLYAVNRNGQYVDIMTGIDGFNLQNGDKLIVYYGDFSTLAVNKMDFSTKKSSEPLEISLNNTYLDFQTNKPVIQPVSGINKVKLDGMDYDIVDGKINISKGLTYGKHSIELNDFRNDKCPSVVADKIDFVFMPEAQIRVEGLSGTIAEGKQKGTNLLEMLENLLKEKGVSYTIKDGQWGKYVEEIGGLKSGKFGGYDGWMCYYKNTNIIDSLPSGLDSFMPVEGDTYVIYYGDFSSTSFVSSITFTPNVVMENKSFNVKFAWKYHDWNTDKDVEKPIVNAIVTIDNLNYVTDSNGEISISSGLSKGEHTYKISGYNIDKLPTVVMDKGVFTINNINSPTLSFDSAKFDQRDNTSIKKDVNSEITNTKNYLSSHSDDPWAALTMQKFGVKGGDTYIKDMSEYIKTYGAADCTITDLEKLIFNLVALGYSPYNFAGTDLISEVLNRDSEGMLINDTLFGLLVYNYANVQGEYNLTREKLVNYIIGKQLSYDFNGKKIEGWALSGDKVNPDITGAVLSALAPYNDDNHPAVKNSIKNAVESLALLQNESGYLADSFGIFSESLSFVIIGLVAVGENPEGVKFTKQKGDLVSALLSFKGTDGQYKHALDGKNDYMATEQALRAMIALKEYKNAGQYDFYKSSIDAKTLPSFDKVDTVKANDSEKTILPQTGSIFDTSTLVASGLMLMFIGIFVLLKKRNSN